MKTSELTFAPIGQFGLSAAVTPEAVYLRIDADKKAAKPSASGKMVMSGSTGGFTPVPGSELKISVNAGFSNKG